MGRYRSGRASARPDRAVPIPGRHSVSRIVPAQYHLGVSRAPQRNPGGDRASRPSDATGRSCTPGPISPATTSPRPLDTSRIAMSTSLPRLTPGWTARLGELHDRTRGLQGPFVVARGLRCRDQDWRRRHRARSTVREERQPHKRRNVSKNPTNCGVSANAMTTRTSFGSIPSTGARAWCCTRTS